MVDLDCISGIYVNDGDGILYGVDFVFNVIIFEGFYVSVIYFYNDVVVDWKDGFGDVVVEFSCEYVVMLGLIWEISDCWKFVGWYKYFLGRLDDIFIVYEDVLGLG